MGREEWVMERWSSLCKDLNVELSLSEVWGEKVHDLYSLEGRYYHNLDHIADMLEGEERDFPHLRRRHLVRLAIFFHDIVYDPKSSSNEEDSEVMFQEFANAAGLSVKVAGTVSEFILATKKHTIGTPCDDDLPALLDLDMAVLGRDRSSYFTYASQIRREYQHVPAQVFCQKRAELLQKFLSDGPIFATDIYREKLEAVAHANVEAEIASLSKGVIPSEQQCSKPRIS